MQKMKLGDFFKTCDFLISECNLAGFPAKNINGKKISFFAHRNFAKTSLQPSLLRYF